jgi:hypothetical protein
VTQLLAAGGAVQTISGVGDKALGAGYEVDAQSGGWIVTVLANAPTASNPLDPEIAVAKAVIAALPAH